MAEGDEYSRRTERIKNLLSSYYGNEHGEGQAPAAEPVSSDHQPSTSKGSFSVPIPAMDSPAFNADKHITQMLKSYTMEKMMTEHHNMAREIKNLDSDMQQLVYENYNKFIAATDTIRTMKTNVDGMGGDMEKLRTIIGEHAELPCRTHAGHAALSQCNEQPTNPICHSSQHGTRMPPPWASSMPLPHHCLTWQSCSTAVEHHRGTC
jgi:hypothetical protein